MPYANAERQKALTDYLVRRQRQQGLPGGLNPTGYLTERQKALGLTTRYSNNERQKALVGYMRQKALADYIRRKYGRY